MVFEQLEKKILVNIFQNNELSWHSSKVNNETFLVILRTGGF